MRFLLIRPTTNQTSSSFIHPYSTMLLMGNYFLMILVENWHDPTHDHLKSSINKMKVDRPVSSPQNPTQMNHCCCDGTFYLHFSSNNLPDHYKCDNIFFSLHKYTSAVLPFETLHPKISTFG